MNDHASLYNSLPSSNHIDFLEQISDWEFWNYAQHLATQQHMPLTTNEQALECQAEQGHYLFPLQALRQIVAPPHQLTLLPLSPPWMPGITAWQGQVIPVVDLASYFVAYKMNKPGTTQHIYPSPSDSLLLILDVANALLGLRIDLVGSIITLEPTQIAAPQEAPLWYPRRLLPTLLGVYQGSVLINSQVLIEQMLQHIKVNNIYE